MARGAAAQRWGTLDHQVGLGPFARGVGRAARAPWWNVIIGLAVVVLGLVALDRGTGRGLAVLGAGILGVALIGTGTRPPMSFRLAWEIPGVLWLLEAAVVIRLELLHSGTGSGFGGAAFAFLAAAAYHRYDTIYRLRDTGRPPSAVVELLGLGADGRIIVLLAVSALWPRTLPTVVLVAAIWLAIVYLSESALGWTRWLRRQAAGR